MTKYLEQDYFLMIYHLPELSWSSNSLTNDSSANWRRATYATEDLINYSFERALGWPNSNIFTRRRTSLVDRHPAVFFNSNLTKISPIALLKFMTKESWTEKFTFSHPLLICSQWLEFWKLWVLSHYCRGIGENRQTLRFKQWLTMLESLSMRWSVLNAGYPRLRNDSMKCDVLNILSL